MELGPMEFGVFHEFPRPEGTSDATGFDHGFELVDAAEKWGLHAIWLAELHISPRSVLASPIAIASAIAARTERMKIGTAVQVLPLAHPLRQAEEWATIDQISKGRLIFGVGRSGFARTYNAYGIPYPESRERFSEALDIILKAWTENGFSYEGKYTRVDNVNVTPKPYQQPHPPIRVAATTPDTFTTLGTQGHHMFAAVRLGTIADLKPDLDRYQAARKAAGHEGIGQVFLRIPVYVADTEQQALEEPERSLMTFYRNMANQLAQSAGEAGANPRELREERSRALESLSYEAARREKVVVGTPDQVTRRLKELREELGLSGILAELNCGGQIPHQQVMHSLNLLCNEVMPHFK
ncbi:MAG TPA: LLM class flavin-dependent oxidoreductase [Chloroflexota bacterium]|nr:LLM class flavin-dependent oxidoreductase [Chloroflexota bacterium]